MKRYATMPLQAFSAGEVAQAVSALDFAISKLDEAAGLLHHTDAARRIEHACDRVRSIVTMLERKAGV